MALIFNDTLEATDGSGSYTLQGYVNGAWAYIATVTGDANGIINVNGSANTIDVDYNVYIPGTSYDFRWIDSNGTVSNEVTYIVPELANIIKYFYGLIPTTLTNNGGDNWTLTVPYTSPTEYGATDTLASMNVQIDFYQGGNVGAYTENITGLTSDTTYDLINNGAGTYNIQVSYIMSNGSQYTPQRVVMVDDGGNILRDVQCNGFTTMSSSLTAITTSIGLVNTGCTVTDKILVLPSDFSTQTILTTGNTLAAVSLPIRTESILAYLCTLLPAEWTDLPANILNSPIGCYTEVFMNI